MSFPVPATLDERVLEALHERLRRQNQAIITLMRRKLGSSDLLLPALREVTEAAAFTLDIERVSLWLFDESRVSIRCIDLFNRSSGEHSANEILTAEDFPAYFRAIDTERTIAATDCLSDPRTRELADDYFIPKGISSTLDVALWIDGNLAGVLCHEHVGPRRTWEIDEILFAGSLADICALTFEICELRHTEEKLAQRLDFKELVAQLSTRFINLPQHAIDEALHDSLKTIGQFSRVESSCLALHDLRTESFHQMFAWSVGSSGDGASRTSAVELPAPFPSDLLEKLLRGESLRIETGTTAEMTSTDGVDRLIEPSPRSLLCAPMLDGEKIFGLVAFEVRRAGWRWHDDTESLLRFAAEMFLNVLKRKQTAEILQAMQFAIDRASDAVFWVGPDGSIDYVNESAMRSLQFTREELLTKKIWEISDTLSEANWPGHWQRIQSGGPITFESAQRTKNGEVFPVEVTVNHLRFQESEYHCAFVRNISDRKLAQEVLEKQRAFFRKVIDMNPNLIFAKDRRGRFVLVNQAVADAYGTTVENLIGKTDADFNSNVEQVEHFHHDDIEVMDSLQEKFVAEEILTDSRGQRRCLQTVKMPIVGRDGAANLVLGVATDITDRKRAEEEQSRLTMQMQHAQKLESLGVLAGGIAHDFNNLLMAILGNVGLAATEAVPRSMLSNRLDQINRAAQRAAELTNQLLAYSGKGQFVVEQLDVGTVVLEMASLLETIVSKKAVLACHFAPNLPLIQADASQVRQVVMNLITNASDALGENSGRIRVSTTAVYADRRMLSEMYVNDELREGDYVCLEVEDSGCGMDPDTLQRIFDPFFSTKFTGRGLGLAAVLGIVRSHHGGLAVESTAGRGTAFRVLFPISARTESSRSVAEEERASDQKESGLVLVVDDEEAARSVTRAMLEHFGFEVVEAADGLQAIEIFEARPEDFRLVVLDMTMPRLDGIETCKELFAIRRNVPVMLTSGYSEEEASSRLNGTPIAAFLQKPYTPDTLRGRVREVLSPDQIGQQPSFHPPRREARRGGYRR